MIWLINNNAMEEIWKPIKGYEELYEVSNIGRVKGLRKYVDVGINSHYRNEKILKQSLDGKGYMMIWLYKDKNRKTMKVHRLVAEAFISNPEKKPQIDHINANKTDNRVCNLRWCTNKENCNNEHARKRNSENNTGVRNNKARRVRQYTLNGVFVREWGYINAVKKILGIGHSHISQCCSGKRNSAGGYVWKYE